MVALNSVAYAVATLDERSQDERRNVGTNIYLHYPKVESTGLIVVGEGE